MFSIFQKEINTYFSSLIAYMVIGVFLLFLGLMMWVFPDYSILDYEFATLEQLFGLAPLIFIFLIPAITMRSFAEEKFTSTIEFLYTKPIPEYEIILGKFLAASTLVAFALLPTLIYYYSVYELGAPIGNIDSGAFWGAYIGLILLGAVFVSIGIFASALTNNQIVAFIIAAFLCFFMYSGFLYISKLPIFFGKTDDFVQMLGIDYHFNSISRGLVDSRDLVYFGTTIAMFLVMTQTALSARNFN